MTDSAVAPAPRVRPLSRDWWAPGLNLRERLSAPGTPTTTSPTDRRGPTPWSLGDEAGFTARSASLGVSEAGLVALAGEAVDRLARRTAKPVWAEYVERAVAAAPGAGPRPVAGDDAPSPAVPGTAVTTEGARAFLPVIRPLIVPAWAAVAERVPLSGDELTVARVAFEDRLGDRLTRQAGRALVGELHAARAAGNLVGNTSRERFDSFTAAAGTRSGLTELFTRYPVLARLLGQSCVLATAAMTELLERYAADRPALVETLLGGEDPGPLTGIEMDRGDSHQGNRSVAVLRFAGGARVVYKPRPLEQHRLLEDSVAWMNDRVDGLDLRTPGSLPRAGYGWLEYIRHRGCSSVTEVDRFYRRQGALLALLYALEGADMHYENVIACGDQPVLIDAETLLHPGLPPALTTGPDPAAEALGSSVHRTCLLPQLLIGENGAVDISALGGPGGEAFPADGLRWVGAGTDDMRVVRGPVACEKGRNRPLLNGGTAGHADHRAALLEGFRRAYDTIGEHRAGLLGADGPVARWAGSPGRLIARSTRLYTTLLEEAGHPAVLGDALARDAVFAVLWTESAHDPLRRRLIEEEITDLWSGDVPVFFHRPRETAVWTARGDRLAGVLPVAGLGSAGGKIAGMGEVDRHHQEWVISATLAVTAVNSGERRSRSVLAPQSAPPVAPEASRLLSAACGIADEIAARAVHGTDRVNWLGLEQITDEHWAVLPMGAGLAQGYCGVALFLAQIGALTGGHRYLSLARRVVEGLPGLLSALVRDPALSAAAGPGALNGLGGIAYTAARLGPLLGGDPVDCLPDSLAALELATLSAEAGDGSGNVADGLAGALACTLAVWGVSGLPGSARLADSLADRLATLPAAGSGGPGFARGEAGTAWALLRHAGIPGSGVPPTVREDAAGSLRTALARALDRPGDLTWYDGLPGTAMAAADALPGEHRGDLERCATLLGSRPLPLDLSPRHGATGVLETLAVLAARGEGRAAQLLRARSGELLGRIERHGPRCGTPEQVPSPGLLSGLAGIGYGLLRLGFPAEVPSVLLLDTPS
ncbi:type 2 lanthipeptide synthetase LanM family protein [Streptomyces sp. ST2-7A]|uniref:type 2 lanthipeptide synthetase LanM family protein n=1 Tax=Streptomyces sp. ST2-7A TaxID=2907214 RepID=UPI001F424DC8|nr:type 2 lanthipeptide synthetase LanM family protein [Streptomyces sp. ST2-7A]MCE7082040.1 type 2 lantipeptide synthetase LanM family protein [Streptomyces sp. ST2-7A]